MAELQRWPKEMIRIATLLLTLASSASAMVFVDSRVVSLSQMEELGVQVEITEVPGPKDARKIWIAATILPLSQEKKFCQVGYSILAKELDADFASTDAKKGGIRDAKKWAKEIRGENSEKPFLKFSVSKAELPNGYIVVHFQLPDDGDIPVFGIYYLPLKDLKEEADQPSQPAPLARDG